MFSQSSSSASLIRLGEGPHFPSTILRSTELASKEESNGNNVTFGIKSSQSRSHMTTIIQNLILISLTSSMTSHPVGLLLGAAVPSLPMHSTLYVLISLYTCLPMQSSHHYVYVLAGTTSCLGIYLRLSTCRSIQFVISISQSNWLDDTRSSLVYHQINQSNWFDGRGPSSIYYQNIQGSWLDDKGLTNAHLQYAIRLANNG